LSREGSEIFTCLSELQYLIDLFSFIIVVFADFFMLTIVQSKRYEFVAEARSGGIITYNPKSFLGFSLLWFLRSEYIKIEFFVKKSLNNVNHNFE
jgi:hypothetical protein